MNIFLYGPTLASFLYFLVARHLQTMTVHINNQKNISALQCSVHLRVLLPVGWSPW